ncbi:MAG: peptidase, partial [Tardiphaga sp.]|nr:peptidase [Tardiphaga sp.]
MRKLKLAALVVLIALMALAATLAFNTFTTGSKQIAVTAIPRVAVDHDAVAKRLAEAIRFRTISSYENPDQAA